MELRRKLSCCLCVIVNHVQCTRNNSTRSVGHSLRIEPPHLDAWWKTIIVPFAFVAFFIRSARRLCFQNVKIKQRNFDVSHVLPPFPYNFSHHASFLRTASKVANSKASLEELSKTAAPNALRDAEFKKLPAEAPKPIQYPFVASIQMVENGRYQHLCGGAILDNEFVLTAAHCNLKPRLLLAKDLLVAAGSNLLFDTKAQRFRVRAIKKHPEFKPLYGHDILLLQLASPIPIDNIRFAAIDFKNSTSRKDGNLNSILLGWGRTTPNLPKQLEVVPFRTISDEMCVLKYKFKYLTRSEICAVNTNGPRGACDGDSGGPLVDATQHTVYGLLSYGRKPCETGKPFAFTRISIYVNWLEEQIRSMRKLNNTNDLG